MRVRWNFHTLTPRTLNTNSYIELSDNPYNEILNKVTQLLNNLYEKDLISKWQYKEMMPDQKKLNYLIYILILKHIK